MIFGKFGVFENAGENVTETILQKNRKLILTRMGEQDLVETETGKIVGTFKYFVAFPWNGKKISKEVAEAHAWNETVDTRIDIQSGKIVDS